MIANRIVLLGLSCLVLNCTTTTQQSDKVLPQRIQNTTPIAALAEIGFTLLPEMGRFIKLQRKKLRQVVDTAQVNPPDLVNEANLSADFSDPSAFLEAALAPPTQVFRINPFQDNLITCEQGTRIFIPEGIFEVHSLGLVEISVQEYYGAAALMSKNLSTVSNGVLLESGGTLNISAELNGQPIEILENEGYVLLFPVQSGFQNGSQEMETFYGDFSDEGQMNWQEAEIDGAPDNSDIALTEFYHYSLTVDDVQNSMWDRPEWALKNDDRTFLKYFEEEFNKIPEASEVGAKLSARNRNYAVLNCDNNGKISSVKIADLESPYDQVLEKFITGMPPLDMTTMYMNNYGHYEIYFGTTHVRDDPKFRKAFRSKYEKYANQALVTANASDINYFILASQEFGWINCDRFYDAKEGVRDLVVEAQVDGEVKTYMIFEEFDAMVSSNCEDGGQVIYKMAPFNVPVKIVGLTFSGSQPLVSVVETTVGDETIVLSEFRPFSISELEELLE